jgi:hypothetical protein
VSGEYESASYACCAETLKKFRPGAAVCATFTYIRAAARLMLALSDSNV